MNRYRDLHIWFWKNQYDQKKMQEANSYKNDWMIHYRRLTQIHLQTIFVSALKDVQALDYS